jgi:hypothetical protein
MVAASKGIPVEAAKVVGELYDLNEVIIIGRKGDTVHMATWGRGEPHRTLAAESGDKLKKMLGWTDTVMHEDFRKDG